MWITRFAFATKKDALAEALKISYDVGRPIAISIRPMTPLSHERYGLQWAVERVDSRRKGVGDVDSTLQGKYTQGLFASFLHVVQRSNCYASDSTITRSIAQDGHANFISRLPGHQEGLQRLQGAQVVGELQRKPDTRLEAGREGGGKRGRSAEWQWSCSKHGTK